MFRVSQFQESPTNPVQFTDTFRTVQVSLARDLSPANGPSEFSELSRDGRHVVFVSSGSNLVGGDSNGEPDIFVVSVPAGFAQ
jgi:hypothetical protein